MQQSFDPNTLNKIQFLVGDAGALERISNVPARKPFCNEIVDFLNELSREIMRNSMCRQYSDVMTFAFWIRKASITALAERFREDDSSIRLGRGVSFHVAPSNVPVNFAYSLVAGLLTGNANIVRVPSKEFAQTGIIADAIEETLRSFVNLSDLICLIRYSRDKEVNDLLSSLADTRIIWGGDETISEIRRSPLPPRSTEITFADRYSLSIIDSEEYLGLDDKQAFASDFYNDTYFSDQNACTSPALVVWTGSKKSEAKKIFWEELHKKVLDKYTFQDVQSVNKLTGVYKVLSDIEGVTFIEGDDNFITRLEVRELSADLMAYRAGSGFFFEYDCDDIMDLKEICNDKRCQTIGILGEREILKPLIESGIKGVDRIVPIGRTMDFDLIWDGYDLYSALTRIVTIC